MYQIVSFVKKKKDQFDIMIIIVKVAHYQLYLVALVFFFLAKCKDHSECEVYLLLLQLRRVLRFVRDLVKVIQLDFNK